MGKSGRFLIQQSKKNWGSLMGGKFLENVSDLKLVNMRSAPQHELW